MKISRNLTVILCLVCETTDVYVVNKLTICLPQKYPAEDCLAFK